MDYQVVVQTGCLAIMTNFFDNSWRKMCNWQRRDLRRGFCMGEVRRMEEAIEVESTREMGCDVVEWRSGRAHVGNEDDKTHVGYGRRSGECVWRQ